LSIPESEAPFLITGNSFASIARQAQRNGRVTVVTRIKKISIMKLRNIVFFLAWAPLLILGSGLHAQNNQDYDLMKDYLSDYMVLASQTQGTCQQVEVFARNGNLGQIMQSAGALSRSMSEIGLIKNEMARRPVPDRLIFASILDLVAGIEGDISLWDAAQRADVPTMGTIASALRESLAHHKGQAQEIRVAICCAYH
jgi:hypothetical protein